MKPLAKPAYSVMDPGLAAVIGACPVSPGHAGLLCAVRQHPGWERARISGERDEGMRLVARKVLGPDGAVVACDHQHWLREQLQAHGGNAAVTRRALAAQRYQLTERELSSVYIVADRGRPRADDFLQLEVRVQNDYLDRHLFGAPHWGSGPLDLQDLLDDLGPVLQERPRLGPASYAAGSALDVRRFVDELDVLDRERRARQAARLVRLTDARTGQSEVKPVAALDPDLTRFPSSARRLFDDWSYSSAGRSGARFCDHWILVRAYDSSDPQGERHMGLTPGWTFRGKLAAVEAKRGGLSDYELAGKLEALDRRVKVPFGWFFFMVHGNRVKDWAGRQMLAAAEAGHIVLPEHDYRVLKNWAARPYGF